MDARLIPSSNRLLIGHHETAKFKSNQHVHAVKTLNLACLMDANFSGFTVTTRQK